MNWSVTKKINLIHYIPDTEKLTVVSQAMAGSLSGCRHTVVWAAASVGHGAEGASAPAPRSKGDNDNCWKEEKWKDAEVPPA